MGSANFRLIHPQRLHDVTLNGRCQLVQCIRAVGRPEIDDACNTSTFAAPKQVRGMKIVMSPQRLQVPTNRAS